MNKKLKLGIENFSIVDDMSDDQLAIVEVYVCHDGNNLHDMPIELSVLKKAKKTLKNKFLVAGYDGEDFEGHEPDEQIVGFFPESSEMRFVEKDGRTYLVAQAIMSKVYAKWAYDVFLNDDNYRSVSMEITVLGTEIKEDGLEYITKFVFNGVTLLGESHLPACEGSNAQIIKFSKESALKIYSKRQRNSDKIKKNFVKDLMLADDSRKEDNRMDEKKKETLAEEEVKEEVSDEKEFAEENKSDETTYMADEEDIEKDKDDEEADKDDEEEETEKKTDDEDKEDEDFSEENMVCKEFESLTVEQKYEVFRSAVKETLNCGYLESYDEEYLYVYDYCDGYTFRYAYTLDGTTCTIDVDSKTRVMRGGYVEFEKYEDSTAKLEALEKENCELKTTLVKYEEVEKSKAVESILSEVQDIVTVDKVAELREDAKNFSLNDLNIFENKVKALAFEAVASKNKSNKYSFTRMTINNEIENKPSKYGW